MAIFVHLDDTDPSNGGLGIFPGSHLKGPQVTIHHLLTLNLDCAVSTRQCQGIRTLSRPLHAQSHCSGLITITNHDNFSLLITIEYIKSFIWNTVNERWNNSNLILISNCEARNLLLLANIYFESSSRLLLLSNWASYSERRLEQRRDSLRGPGWVASGGCEASECPGGGRAGVLLPPGARQLQQHLGQVRHDNMETWDMSCE